MITDLNTYYPLIWKLRSGTNGDPYVELTDRKKIIHGRIALHEVPSFSYKVNINGFYEVSKEEYEENKGVLALNEFYVDYQGSFIYFNESKNGETLEIKYLGTGIAQIPAERIWVHSNNPYAVDNLQEYIDKCDGFIASCQEELNKFLKNLDDLYLKYENKTNETYDKFTKNMNSLYQQYDENINLLYNDFIKKINQKAKDFALYINDFIKRAEVKIDEISKQITLSEMTLAKVLDSLAKCILAAKNCEEQTDIAKRLNAESVVQIDKMKQEINNCKDFLSKCTIELENLKKDRLSTKVNWLQPVHQYVDILNKYQKPNIGDTVQTTIDGKAFRWDGYNWCYTFELTANTDEVTEVKNGLMRAEDYVKLKTIEEGAEKNLEGEELKYSLPDYMKERTLIFYLGDRPKEGVINAYMQFPCNGRITEVKAFARLAGDEPTELFVEKISEVDFGKNLDRWVQVNDSNTPILLKPLQKVSEKNVIIINKNVKAGDYFRVSLTKLSTNIKNITVQVVVTI